MGVFTCHILIIHISYNLYCYCLYFVYLMQNQIIYFWNNFVKFFELCICNVYMCMYMHVYVSIYIYFYEYLSYISRWNYTRILYYASFSYILIEYSYILCMYSYKLETYISLSIYIYFCFYFICYILYAICYMFFKFLNIFMYCTFIFILGCTFWYTQMQKIFGFLISLIYLHFLLYVLFSYTLDIFKGISRCFWDNAWIFSELSLWRMIIWRNFLVRFNSKIIMILLFVYVFLR